MCVGDVGNNGRFFAGDGESVDWQRNDIFSFKFKFVSKASRALTDIALW